MAKFVRLDDKGGIRTVTLARPQKLNAVTREVLSELEDAFIAARASSVRVVVLRGEGKSFCAGADIVNELGEASLARASSFLKQLARILLDIYLLPKPVIAAIQGHAAGAGAELALAADLQVVATGAELWFPDVAMGSSPASMYHLVRCVGRAKAVRMAMLQERLTADQMLECGITDRLVAPSELDSAALETARRVAALAPEPLRLAKEGLRCAYEASHEVELAANVSSMLVCHVGEDQRRAVRSFANRRAPSNRRAP